MCLLRESDLLLLSHWLAQEAALIHTNPPLAAAGTAVGPGHRSELFAEGIYLWSSLLSKRDGAGGGAVLLA